MQRQRGPFRIPRIRPRHPRGPLLKWDGIAGLWRVVGRSRRRYPSHGLDATSGMIRAQTSTDYVQFFCPYCAVPPEVTSAPDWEYVGPPGLVMMAEFVAVQDERYQERPTLGLLLHLALTCPRCGHRDRVKIPTVRPEAFRLPQYKLGAPFIFGWMRRFRARRRDRRPPA